MESIPNRPRSWSTLTRAQAPTLPLELQFMILDVLVSEAGSPTIQREPTLQACMGVCRPFYDYLTPIVYKRIVCYSSTHTKEAHGFLSHSPHLLKHVRGLSLRKAKQSSWMDKGSLVENLLVLLSENALEDLSITFTDTRVVWMELRDNIRTALLKATGPGSLLHTLSLVNAEISRNLFDGLSSEIRVLDIRGTTLPFQRHHNFGKVPMSPIPRPQLKVERIALFHSRDVVAHLCSRELDIAFPELKTIDLPSGYPALSTDSIEHLIRHAPNLERLRVSANKGTYSLYRTPSFGSLCTISSLS
ncbi:hypothetical protein DFP72DRAFT_543987 [Ephemerocybe angulata]|uniref:Uncharacterized protein n=1 Tax=Ephemerocybe angulata TaxID=980116 RepID=A0A8H6LYY8_9AGAR|nr:hypothetical protein DFP72DRAFT_543987 [Tulosesus angulatus]